jgi:ZIP family zinc transporter/zinc and cadmium transporter
MRLSPLLWSLLLGTAAALANVAGGLVVVTRKHWNELLLKYFIALGAGFMLAAAFLRMLPASMALTAHAPLLILAGYFLVHFFEHTVAPHFHFGEEVHDDVMVNPAVGVSALVGLSTHTFFDGVSISSGFLVSVPLGLLIFFAVLLHKVPEGFTVASIALASGRGKQGAITASIVVGAATLAGVLGMHQFAGAVPYALPLSAGVTLYVAASDLIPEVNEERGIRMALVVFLGVALFYAAEALMEGLGLEAPIEPARHAIAEGDASSGHASSLTRG